MQKLFYLLFDELDNDGTKLRESLCELAVPVMQTCGAVEISVFGSDADVAAGRPVRQSDPSIRAMTSFWLNDAADRGPVEKALARLVEGSGSVQIVDLSSLRVFAGLRR